MVPLQVVGKLEWVGGMVVNDVGDDGGGGGWRRMCVWENVCAHTQQ